MPDDETVRRQPDPDEETADAAEQVPLPPAEPARPARVARAARGQSAWVVAVAGMLVVLLIALAGFLLLPGPADEGQSDTGGVFIVAIATAAVTAVGMMVAAYLGIMASNVAREDAERASFRHEIWIAALAAAAPTAAAHAANREAGDQIRELGL
jgi:hypothetical protein